MKATLKILSTSALLATLAPLTSCTGGSDEDIIHRHELTLASDTLTPEVLWAMGRIGAYAVAPNGGQVCYQVTYYSVEQNRSNTLLYVAPLPTAEATTTSEAPSGAVGGASTSDVGTNPTLLGLGSSPVWLSDDQIAFAAKGEVWTMDASGRGRKQLTHTDGAVQDFHFSPDGQKLLLVKAVPFHDIIHERPADLPKSTGMVITDLMYRHWDHYVESIPHPFVLDLQSGQEYDLLEGQPFECPMEPFGGIEQLAWSPDSRFIAFTCRTRTGVAHSISTDSDIFLFDTQSRDLGAALNLCKPGTTFADAVAASATYLDRIDPSKALRHQAVNQPDNVALNNPGYDQNPQFSPDGRYVAWLSMARDGYEADRQRLCVLDLQAPSHNKTYLTEQFDSNVDAFVWGADNRTLYFIGVWHGTVNLYRTNMEGQVAQLTNLQADWGSLQLVPNTPATLLMERHDHFHPADLYLVTAPSEKSEYSEYSENSENSENSELSELPEASVHIAQVTHENDHLLNQLTPGSEEVRWCRTTDGQQLHYWVVKPPHFDPAKKYPTLLFCEGGPQSPVSQFWSYRWNFYIMASQGYVLILPNRRGLPGFGQEWLEQISGDWTGQCMNDYLSAIDDACDSLPYVDRDRLGAVGASFGGFSVYYLAGHHEGRFKCFIAHDGAFNLEAMYTETEENWFSNWEYDDAYWNRDRTANAERTYRNSPHQFVDQWDTPILCIHGEKDYRINATQGMSAFNAARMRGIEAELLLYPDENHWVLKPQNGILWQRTYFDWLGRWLK
ncbi:MAG: S9 family peptidase [Bacteroidaceae bacterium]|nr:S9 family peptidase [Bacteroidaceae bacterium]